MATLPKKILKIRDAVFVLPDDFEGSFHDALHEFLKYQESLAEPHDTFKDPNGLLTPLGILLGDEDGHRVAAELSIYELKDGNYIPVDKAN